jgi:hypothetical protein
MAERCKRNFTFKNSATDISYDTKFDIDNKLKNRSKIIGAMNIMLRPQETLKKTRIKLYNTLALRASLRRSVNCNNKAMDARRITAAGMKHMTNTAGYTWTEYKINTEIAKEINRSPVLDKIQEYRRNWLQHTNRMPSNGLPRILKYDRPTGKRNNYRDF